jgi:hypothetical protein
MHKAKTRRPTLSFERAAALCLGFLPLGDRVEEFGNSLMKSGFSAFLPFERFILSHAVSPEEIDLHNRLVVENAKMFLATPWPLVLVQGRQVTSFRSELIEHLNAKRDAENGVPVHELELRYSIAETWWRSQIDPCYRNMARFQAANKDIYDARWAEVVDEMKSDVAREADHFATSLSAARPFDMEGRYNLFTAVMERDAKKFGFERDKNKSRKRFPVLSNHITDIWDLCWAVEEEKMFLWNLTEGRFTPYLEVRRRDLRGNLTKGQAGEYLHIRYSAVVPGFFNAYRTFHSPQELEVLIKAHLFLYGMMAPVFERAMKEVLGAAQAM